MNLASHTSHGPYALKTSLEILASYYEDLHLTTGDPADSRYFPSITTYPQGRERVEFEYVGFLETALTASLFAHGL
jgi:hypothetical protein